MKKIWFLFLFCVLILVSCQNVQRTYTKNSSGVTVTSTCEDGKTSTEIFADPSVKSLTDMGLEERQAVNLISKGEAAVSNSSELTTFGWVVVIIIFVLVIILMFATGNGAEAADVVGDVIDLVD